MLDVPVPQLIHAGLPTHQLLNEWARAAAVLLGADLCAIVLKEPRSDALYIRGYYGLPPAYVDQVNADSTIQANDSALGRGPTGMAYSTGMTVTISDVRAEEDFRPWLSYAEVVGYRALVSLPLVCRERRVGVLNAYWSTPRQWPAEQLERYRAVAGLVAHAVYVVNVAEALREHAWSQHRGLVIHSQLVDSMRLHPSLPHLLDTAHRIWHRPFVVATSGGEILAEAGWSGLPSVLCDCDPAAYEVIPLPFDPALSVWTVRDPPLDETDRQGLEEMATLANLCILGETLIRRERQAQEEALVNQLISPQGAAIAQWGPARRVELPVMVVLVDLVAKSGRIEAAISRIRERWDLQWGAVLWGPVGHPAPMLWTPNRAIQREPRLAQATLEAYARAIARLGLGVYLAGGRLVRHIEDIPRSYEGAQRLLALLRKWDRPGNRAMAEPALRGLQVLLHTANWADLEHVYQETMGPLLQLPSPTRTLLLETLLAYMERNGNAKATAEVLGIHPNTLSYRLRRLEEVLGMNFADLTDCLTLKVIAFLHPWMQD